MRLTKKYVIMANFRDDETDAPLFWSNELGWTELSEADVFSLMGEIRLPVEAWGYLILPE